MDCSLVKKDSSLFFEKCATRNFILSMVIWNRCMDRNYRGSSPISVNVSPVTAQDYCGAVWLLVELEALTQSRTFFYIDIYSLKECALV